jgi:hypothetical protein
LIRKCHCKALDEIEAGGREVKAVEFEASPEPAWKIVSDIYVISVMSQALLSR